MRSMTPSGAIFSGEVIKDIKINAKMILGNLYHEIMNHHESRLRRNVSKANRRFVHKKVFDARRIWAKFCMRQKSSGNTYDTFAWQRFNEMMTQAKPSTTIFFFGALEGWGGVRADLSIMLSLPLLQCKNVCICLANSPCLVPEVPKVYLFPPTC